MIKITLIVVCFAAIIIEAISANDILCPHPNGKFGVSDQCDAYIECTDGIAEAKLCPDGLLFNEELSPDGECQYKPSVICGNRTKLQPPQPTEDCPHQFGFYRIGDSSHCQNYLNCAHGVGEKTKCPEGLAFNEKTYKCDWPDETFDCDSEKYLDFQCPEPIVRAVNEDGNEIEPEKLKYYRNEQSCKHYFVCVNNKPRLYACAKFLVFNEERKGCNSFSDIQELNSIFECPEDDDGFYPDPEQCDAYIECKDGVQTHNLCPDGLVYNHKVRHSQNKCQFKPLVDCGNRSKFQKAKPTKRCRHQHGMFKIGDEAHCAKYYNCAHGVGTLSKCPTGLAFNEENYRCDFPELVEACNATAYLGFKCPEPTDNIDDYDEAFVEKPKHYRDEKNWNHYFICDVEGNVRKYACPKGLIYNVEAQACEVEEFEYYDDDEDEKGLNATTVSTTTAAKDD